MRYLHTMVRISDVAESLDFYCNKLGLKLTRKNEYPNGRFTLAFVSAPIRRTRLSGTRVGPLRSSPGRSDMQTVAGRDGCDESAASYGD